MSILHKHSIYPIETESGGIFLYAPLAGIIAETSKEEIKEYEHQIKTGEIPSELHELIIKNNKSVVQSPDIESELTILINQRCNFACKYCYSANGRSNAELPEPLFLPLVKWFISPAQKGEQLCVTFSGGGDPTLSFDKVRKLITMMREEAAGIGAAISFGMVCNGSRVKDDDLEFIRENFDNLVISFDVIPEVHDAQRSHYPEVADTIRTLSKAKVKFGLRSTITSLNVERMEEMVRILHRDFPECRSLAMEAALTPDVWETPEQLQSFYSMFVENFFKAQALADSLGISIGNTIELSSEGLKSRACEGKIVVTPEGRLTACSRVATPGDHHFYDFEFGQVTTDGVTYDANKYNNIMSVRADNITECPNCFARYHCGGGCMLARLSYSPEQMSQHCNFTRQILKHKILNELDR